MLLLDSLTTLVWLLCGPVGKKLGSNPHLGQWTLPPLLAVKVANNRQGGIILIPEK